APRHLLISPSAEALLDPAATGAALDAMEEAPWIVSGSTGALMDAADQQEWTTDPRSETGALYTLGRTGPDELRPRDRAEGGAGGHLDSAEDPPPLDAA